MKFYLLLLFCGLLLCNHVLFAKQIYRWVDEDGITHFSQNPPPAAVKTQKAAQRVVLQADKYKWFTKIDQHVLDTPKSATQSIKSLAAYLRKPAENEKQIARAIYRWVTHNLFYDAKGLLVRGTLGSQDAVNALESRVVVCEGYARLYEALGKAAGLDVVTVIGYSKGYGDIPGDHFGQKSNQGQKYTIDGVTYSGTQVKHAWNAVKIDGQWHLLDTTWGAGYLDNKYYRRHFTDYYFLTPPDKFIFDHFPDHPRWQLLSKPLTLREYDEMVVLGPAFFRHGLSIGNYKKGVIDTINQTRINLGAPKGVFLFAKIEALSPFTSTTQELGSLYTGVQRNKQNYQIDVALPAAGSYLLRIYAGNNLRKMQNAVNYTLNASTGMNKYALPMFPEPEFYETGLSLGQHTKRVIQARDTATLAFPSSQDININAALFRGKQELADNLLFLQHNKQKYEIKLRLPQAGEYALRIYAQPNHASSSELPMVLHYIIQARAGNKKVFPESYRAFHTRQVALRAPLDRDLTTGAAETFILTVPDARDVVVGKGKQWTKLNRSSGNNFSNTVKIPRGQFTVFARFGNRKKYEGLLGYQGM